MKYLLVLAIVWVAVWLWRKNRLGATSRGDTGQQVAKKRGAGPLDSDSPMAMLRCAVCGVHLPKSDAVTTQNANYCSAAHRAQAGE